MANGTGTPNRGNYQAPGGPTLEEVLGGAQDWVRQQIQSSPDAQRTLAEIRQQQAQQAEQSRPGAGAPPPNMADTRQQQASQTAQRASQATAGRGGGGAPPPQGGPQPTDSMQGNPAWQGLMPQQRQSVDPQMDATMQQRNQTSVGSSVPMAQGAQGLAPQQQMQTLQEAVPTTLPSPNREGQGRLMDVIMGAANNPPRGQPQQQGGGGQQPSLEEAMGDGQQPQQTQGQGQQPQQQTQQPQPQQQGQQPVEGQEAGGEAQDSESFLQNVGSTFGEALEDPAFQNALLQFGVSMLQPRPTGQTFAGQFGQSVLSGQQGYQATQEAQRERQASAREASREEREVSAEETRTEAQAEANRALAEQRVARAQQLRTELSQSGMSDDNASAAMADARVLSRIAADAGRYDSQNEALEDIYWQITATGMQDPDQWYADQISELQAERSIMDDSNYERARSTIADLRDRMKENQGRRGQSGRQQGQGQGQGQGQTPREESTQTGGQQYNPGDTYSIDGVQAEVIDVAPDGRLRVRNPQTGQEAIVTPES